ncbi:MAG TPA: ester cyclase, partial [Coriobacteriia bacterium]|nr:ester cyclase [Coriobacteriia bacterium]
HSARLVRRTVAGHLLARSVAWRPTMGESLASRVREANAAILLNGDLTAIPQFFAPDYLAHVTDSDVTGGHNTVRRMVERWRRAFPDMAVEVEILVEGADRVAWQRTLRATHAQDYMGFPATGRKLVWRYGHESIRGRPHRRGLGHYRPRRAALEGEKGMNAHLPNAKLPSPRVITA